MRERRQIDSLLQKFYREEGISDFREALSIFCKFFQLKKPKIIWRKLIDAGQSAGRTYEGATGPVMLIHPRHWKKSDNKHLRHTSFNWKNVFYHEMGHFVHWSDAEQKADAFARKMERGL